MVKRLEFPVSKERETSPCTLFSKYENGRIRNLKFDVNALADFEQETGMGFAQLMKQKAIFGTARAMAWAGMKHEDRTLSIERVGNLISSFISDREIPKEQRDINTVLEVLFSAAIDQEALGFERQDEPETTSVEVTDPNASKMIQETTPPDLPGSLGSVPPIDSQ